jgi:GTPase SAR1 family protein
MLAALYPWKPEECRCLMIGNDASGKTSILYKLVFCVFYVL